MVTQEDKDVSLDLSIDIETLGKGPEAPVVAIGWCWFSWDNPGIQPHGMQYHVLNVEQQMKAGAVADYDTISWWMQQSDAARSANFPHDYSRTNFEAPLDVIPHLLEEVNRAKQIWAKGPDFDCVILNSMVRRAAPFNYPWPFWKHRDVRTAMRIVSTAYPAIHAADAHNALNDAVHQANLMREAGRTMQELYKSHQALKAIE